MRFWVFSLSCLVEPVDDPQIALAVLVENGGGGSVTAAPIGRALFDYWILQRKTNPILPPSADEMKIIQRQKAFEKALQETLREKEVKALEEQTAPADVTTAEAR